MTTQPPLFAPTTQPLITLSRQEPLVVAARSFIFVRHGQTDGNANKIFQTAEQPLNSEGLAQAREASAVLKSHPVQRIRASTMERAWRTAHIIAEPHRIAVEGIDDLRERWFGSLVGTPSTVVDWGFDPPAGERLADFVARTRRGFASSLEEESGTVAVAHGGCLYVLAFGLGADVTPEHFHNATPLLFEREGARWRVTQLSAGRGAPGAVS